MSWMEKVSARDRIRVEKNLRRLAHLKSVVHDLSYFVLSSQSGGLKVLSDLLNDNLVKGREKIFYKLEEAMIGENNQKLALDAPHRFQKIMREAEEIIDVEINDEEKKLRDIIGDQ